MRCPNSESIKEFLNKVQLLPRQNLCGRDTLVDKIGGGKDTDIREFPWTALLRYKNEKNDLVYGCNGNLINERYVITAAHCVEPVDTRTL